MASSPCFAQYCTFQTADKDSGGYLLSADSLVGDLFDITFKTQDGVQTAFLNNRFGHEVGYFDRNITHKLLLFQADGWELHAILSAVFFSERDGGGYYWGEVALVCFSKRYSQEFTTFMEGISSQIRTSKRPALNLKPQTINNILESGGTWIPKDREPKRTMKEGTVVIKDYLKYDERLIEMARNRNIGCFIIGWAFIFALVAMALYIIWSLLPF